ncbi:MAG: YraN family protein [Fimbriimonadales bacterium]|nr:YraN family protein [Fimbriimonadales bacterium]
MAFTVSDLQEMIHLLEQHPDWKQVLRLMLLGEELLNLPQLMRELLEVQRQHTEWLQRLTEGQQRHEEWLQRLTEGQQRHEEILRQHTEWLQRLTEGQQRHEEILRQHTEWLQRLTEGQQRHEEILRQHTEWLQRLTEGQQRHEERLNQLAITQQRGFQELRSELTRLTTKLGLDIEEQAEDTLQWVMEQKGWRLVEGPRSINVNGEIDVVAVFENEQGERVTVVMEVKLRLNRRTVEAWSNRVRSEGFVKRLQRQGLTPPYWVYLFGFRVEWTAGKLAEQRQLGLMTGRGGVLPPVQLLP